MSSNTVAQQLTLSGFVARKIHGLYAGVSTGSSAARASLSNLRRAVGRDPAKHPLSWQYVLTAEEEAAFPEHHRGSTDEPSPGEYAAYIALTLYAVHQQSEAQNMHSSQQTFGYAVGRLVQRRNPSIKKRFDALMQARTFGAMMYHTRALVQLLKQEELSFDYAKFAGDLVKLQNPQQRSKVITRWSRDFVSGYGSVTYSNSK